MWSMSGSPLIALSLSLPPSLPLSLRARVLKSVRRRVYACSRGAQLNSWLGNARFRLWRPALHGLSESSEALVDSDGAHSPALHSTTAN